MSTNQLPTKATMTAAQEKHLEIARIAMMAQAPFFGYFYYSEMVEYPTLDISTAGVDGRRMFFNPEYFMTLSVQEVVFALTHETYHAVQRHPQRMKSYRQSGTIRQLPYNNNLFNIVADFIINADLVKNNIGRMNPDWLLDPAVKGDELVEDIYHRYYKKPPPPPPGGGGQGQGPTVGSGSTGPQPTAGAAGQSPKGAKGDPRAAAAGGRFDALIEPRVDDQGREDVPTDGQFKEAVARAAAAAKAMGKLPASIERMVEHLLTPQVDWKEHVRMLLTGRMGHRHPNWQRPNRRRIVLNPIIYMPGKRGFGADTVCVVVDNSGSISKKEYDAFYSEIGGVLQDVKPKRIIVIWCDAAVQRVEEVRSLDELITTTKTTTRGGGGTDFRPPFKYLQDNHIRPETLIYLTDMYGSFPAEPNYPVVWCATTDQKAPFGDVVKIEVE
jgi:predicted metal-dependent peptidase